MKKVLDIFREGCTLIIIMIFIVPDLIELIDQGKYEEKVQKGEIG